MAQKPCVAGGVQLVWRITTLCTLVKLPNGGKYARHHNVITDCICFCESRRLWQTVFMLNSADTLFGYLTCMDGGHKVIKKRNWVYIKRTAQKINYYLCSIKWCARTRKTNLQATVINHCNWPLHAREHWQVFSLPYKPFKVSQFKH